MLNSVIMSSDSSLREYLRKRLRERIAASEANSLDKNMQVDSADNTPKNEESGIHIRKTKERQGRSSQSADNTTKNEDSGIHIRNTEERQGRKRRVRMRLHTHDDAYLADRSMCANLPAFTAENIDTFVVHPAIVQGYWQMPGRSQQSAVDGEDETRELPARPSLPAFSAEKSGGNIDTLVVYPAIVQCHRHMPGGGLQSAVNGEDETRELPARHYPTIVQGQIPGRCLQNVPVFYCL